MTRIQRILVPVDFSDHSATAMEMAVDWAKQFGAKIRLLHCYEIRPIWVTTYEMPVPEDYQVEIRKAASRQLQAWLEKVKAEGIEADATLSPCFAKVAIADIAERDRSDLIIMGTRGRTGLKHIVLGSVAERTLRTAPCPVCIVRASDT